MNRMLIVRKIPQADGGLLRVVRVGLRIHGHVCYHTPLEPLFRAVFNDTI